jgi:hypothetical protein
MRRAALRCKNGNQAPGFVRTMSNSPALTHHEIIQLVAPFARRGRHVDLAASDRAGRRLVFKPIEREAGAGSPVGLSESLRLDCRDDRRFVLDRIVTDAASGQQATLQAIGPRPEELLATIDAVPWRRHFESGNGWRITRSYEVLGTAHGLPALRRPDIGTDPRDAASTPEPALFLTRGVVAVDGLVLEMDLRLPTLRGIAANLTLTPSGAGRLQLPEDLLAVQGWDWARLVPNKAGWTSRLRLRGAALRRTATAEQALLRVAGHLVATFADSPGHFHDRHRPARWAMVLRRAIPSLTAVLMIVGALLLPAVTDTRSAGLWMALQYLPIALLAMAFSLQELPQFEIPPLPRRSQAARWREQGEDPAGSAPQAAATPGD